MAWPLRQSASSTPPRLARRRRRIRRLQVVSATVICGLYSLALVELQAAPRWSNRLGDPLADQAVTVALIRAQAMPAAPAKPRRPAAAPRPTPVAPTDPNPLASPAPPSAEPEPEPSTQDLEALAAFQPRSAQGDPQAPCALAEALAHDLQTSPLAQQGLERLPRAARSVANAVQLWDGRWNAEMAGGPLLRGLIEREIAAAPPACAHQVNQGPIFLLAAQNAATIVLVLGSGEWRWGDLIAP